jgi:hypothetical protein
LTIIIILQIIVTTSKDIKTSLALLIDIQMKPITDKKYLDVLKKSLSSEKSYENYVVRFKKLKEITGTNRIHNILVNPKEYYPLIKEHYPNINTRKNMMTPILKLFTLFPNLQKAEKDKHDQWKRNHDDMNILQEAHIKKNKMTQKQKDNYISFEDVQLHLTKMKNQNPHTSFKQSLYFVLLNLLIDIKPKRSDLGCVKIYRGEDPNKQDENYIILKEERDNVPSYLVLNVYNKTVYGTVIEDLKKDTSDAIRDSLRVYPRDYLFVDVNKRPYTISNSYGKFVTSCFNDIFEKKVGTSLWRHIFIMSDEVQGNKSDEELADIARKMLHSPTVQRQYRFVNNKKDDGKVCVCLDKEEYDALKAIKKS